MNVLLISSNTATSPYPVYPLGMSTIAAALARAGHEATMFDFLSTGQSMDALREALRRRAYGLVGISIRNLDNVNLLHENRYTAVLPEIVRCSRELTGAPVVLGGSGYSILPEQVLRHAGADYGIVGEGEHLILELVDSLQQHRAPPPGTILRNGNHLRHDSIGRAHYDHDLLQAYLGLGSVIPIQTKRGCTLRCAYCSYPDLEGREVRPAPVERVVDDIERLVQTQKSPYLFFTDSVFNDDQGHYLELLGEMKRRGIRVPWTAFLKPTGLTEDAARLMRETGLASAELGTDAACDATLRGIGKPFRFADVVRANDILMGLGVPVAHYVMFGGPGETPETVRQGIENIRSLRCTAVFVFLGIRILPRTRLHQRAIEDGVIAADQDLFNPVYYVSPAIDAKAVERTLTEAFAPLGHVVFPPDAMDDKLQLLHKLGYAGSLWELLAPAQQK